MVIMLYRIVPCGIYIANADACTMKSHQWNYQHSHKFFFLWFIFFCVEKHLPKLITNEARIKYATCLLIFFLFKTLSNWSTFNHVGNNLPLLCQIMKYVFVNNGITELQYVIHSIRWYMPRLLKALACSSISCNIFLLGSYILRF